MERVFDLLSHLYYRVFGSTELRPYESACLEAWKEQWSPEAARILGKQLGSYDFTQRHAAGKLLCFHCSFDRGCRKWPTDAFFPLHTGDEMAVARVGLRRVGASGRASLKADLLVGDGRFFGIEFNKRPDTIFPKGTTAEQIEVTDVKVLVDVMQPDPYATGPITDAAQLRGWLREWAAKWELRGLRHPLPADVRKRLAGQLDARLPADYLELVAQTEGVKVGPCTIYGISQVWAIPWPEETFHVLADIEGRGSVGVRQGDNDGMLHHIEDDVADPAGPSLRAIIEKEIKLAQQEQGETT